MIRIVVALSVACVLHSAEGLSATLRSSVQLPKEVVIERMLRRKLEVVPAEQFKQAAVVIATELEKRDAGRPVDQASVNWALSPIFKTVSKAMTEECRSTTDCTVEYLDVEVAERPPSAAPKVDTALVPAVCGAIVAGLWLVSTMCFGGIAAKLAASRPALAAFVSSQPLFTAIASKLSCSVGQARAAVAFGYAVCTSTLTTSARLARSGSLK